jgi:hypothetical protein
MDIKIDKGVPIQPRRQCVSSKYRRAFSLMEVGDSFSVDALNQAIAAKATAKKDGYKTAVRKQADGSYRVWRTK